MSTRVRLRKKVVAFAQLIENKLREHGKNKRNLTTHYCLIRLLEETADLVEAFNGPQSYMLAVHHTRLAARCLREYTRGYYSKDPESPHDARISKSVEVANFCMALTDVMGGLTK